MVDKTDNKEGKPMTERQQRIYDFLNSVHVGVLATVDPNGEPHGAVIYHCIDPAFTMSFLTKTGTKKYDNLVRHNHTMLVVFEPVSQTVVQVTGKAVEIKNTDEINRVAEAVFEVSSKTSEGGISPITKLAAGEYAAFKIEPVQIRMASYIRPDPGDYAQLFESIESFELKDQQP